tara:strand:- start:6900 stop:7613 length:714 start_codon:yes stop_codon:yes gene_type:complete
MKEMIMCGDSYMTPSDSHPNTHFAELTAEALDYHLTVYSKGGMSNLGICLQIEEAIRKKPDLILFSTTSYDRIEIPLGYKDSGLTDWHRRPYTMQDIIRNDMAEDFEKENSSNLISDTLHRLLKNKRSYRNLPKIDFIKQSIRYYFEFLHDPVWQKQKDVMCLYACLHKLHESKIPYFYMLSESDVLERCSFIDKQHTLFDKKSMRLNQNQKDPGYHTTPERQFEISRTLIESLKNL